MKRSFARVVLCVVSLVLFTRVGWAQTQPPPTSAPPTPMPSAPPSAGAPPSIVQPATPGGSAGEKDVSLWGALTWNGIGIGGRFMLPLPITSILANAHTSLKDSWALEFGADYLHWDCGIGTYSCSWNELLPVVGMMWKLDINDRLTVYPKVEGGYHIGWYSGGDFAGRGSYAGVYVAGIAGVMYRLSNGLVLRAEAGSYDIRGGIGWSF